MYKTDKNELVAALVRGDHEINELKLQEVLGCQEVALATEAEVEAATQVASWIPGTHRSHPAHRGGSFDPRHARGGYGGQ